MRQLFGRLGLAALARRVWPRLLASLRLEGPGEGADPLIGARQPLGKGPLRGRSAGVALEEPHDTGLADAIGKPRRR
jgi:hypothetical protein